MAFTGLNRRYIALYKIRKILIINSKYALKSISELQQIAPK